MEQNTSFGNSAQVAPAMPPAEPKKSRLVWLVLLGVLVALSVFGAWWQINTDKSEEAGIKIEESGKVATTTVAVSWRIKGLPLSDQGLLNINSNYAGSEKVSYYDLGQNGKNTIILAEAPPEGPGSLPKFFFEKQDGRYVFMSAMSSKVVTNPINDYEANYGIKLSNLVDETDNTIIYQGIQGPVSLNYRGLSLKNRYIVTSGLFEVDFKNALASKGENGSSVMIKVDDINQGEMYIWRQKLNGVVINRYVLKLPSGFYTEYNISYPFFTDDSVPQIIWTDGSANTDTYSQAAATGGCGNPGALVTPGIDVSSQIKVTGRTASGESIYELTDINHPIMAFFYKLGGKVYHGPTEEMESLTVEEWAAHHPVVFYKNAIGDYVIFTNNTYGLAAECGKPVIYLYPPTPMDVRVRVGADVTVSEPTYGDGWQVKAYPDGIIVNSDGKKYESLFWEGTGHGLYPNVMAGTVVSAEEVESILTRQLVQLGLNDKELADFLEFWLPNMPTTPYVRLTWFTTEEMNELAPLALSPRPDTLIRVFLDFQGLQEKISLPPQQLTALPRRGFTVIEWGGILQK
ncbi:MAG: hypothetical protein A2571_02930 [Candidatus Vogelbacteria bacterium RIFOXYD1_FULL_44_32]|uniref:Uncharacterized protein n=1 Tax=Candidatus Vogelbacteria bacterium RIFOXYD1_FULL_44_32 TaxID=1802438 RepID=A0A1G2QCA1_9BACT|nr:MAG: hypothetical protein A2571_02930 [Candidatus Vogelbacteria bacterium RIFOXYD1_FULL_44_32]